MRNPLSTVNHKEDNRPNILKHCIGLIVSNFLNSMCFSFFSDPRSIIDSIPIPHRFKFSDNIVSRCTQLILNLCKFFPNQSIQKRRFPWVWFPYNSKSDPFMCWLICAMFFIWMRFSPLFIKSSEFIFELREISFFFCTNSDYLRNSQIIIICNC